MAEQGSSVLRLTPGRSVLAGHRFRCHIHLVRPSFTTMTLLTSIRLQEETAKVEKCLLEGNFTEAIVQCFNAPKANAFDYNLLEPLQKLLRLSSPVAASLARHDLFSGILQKLNHKKAVVRLNLLRIVRSICDPSDEEMDAPRRHELFEAIQRLSESDNAVLVRNMASELVKSNIEKDSESSSGERQRRGQLPRRQSLFVAPSLQQSASAPMTPTHPRVSQTQNFTESSLTPRRMGLTSNSGESFMYRPRSRDGPNPIARRTPSAELINNSAAVVKSRLPRTSMLKTSRSSMAAPILRDEVPQPAPSRREAGVRLRDQTRSITSFNTASPAIAESGTVPQLNSKRRNRAPSTDIKWS